MDVLPDPYDDRSVKTVECPPNKALPDNILYPYKGISLYWYQYANSDLAVGADKDKPDWRLLKDFMMKEGPLRKD